MERPYEGVKQAFDSSAREYDHLRRQLIPCFDDFYGMVVRQMPFDPSANAAVLDLGAGTGLLSGLLLQVVGIRRVRWAEALQIGIAAQVDPRIGRCYRSGIP